MQQNTNQNTTKPEHPGLVICWHGWTVIGYAIIWLIVHFWVAPKLELPKSLALCFATAVSSVSALISQLALRIYLELTASSNQNSP